MSELPSRADPLADHRVPPPPGPEPAGWAAPSGVAPPPTGGRAAGGGPIPAGPAERGSTAGEVLQADDDGSAPAGDALPLPLAETAALMGEYRWVEHALYTVLGQWVTDMPLAAVQVHLDSQSLRHAWHAELWAERLPVRDGVDPDALTVPSPPSAVLVSALAGTAVTAGTAGTGLTGAAWAPDEDDPFDHPGALPRLAGLYRVALPRLVTSYERHLRAAAPVTDGPVARALRLVLNDEIEDWRAGERLVQRLVTRPHDVVAVHEFLQRLESAVVGAGAASGLVTFPASVPGD